jgi:thiol-disulfide isomerase/thioredoxin
MKALAIFALLVAAPAETNTAPAHPEAALYDPSRAAQTDVDAALARAKAANQRLILVMGANWCHDSKGLAGWFETPRFKSMLAAKYQLVYVDVGMPQLGKGRNIDIAQRFGIKRIKGTPTVLILSPEGILLNKKDAPGWRNAASRNEDDVFRFFAEFEPRKDR